MNWGKRLAALAATALLLAPPAVAAGEQQRQRQQRQPGTELAPIMLVLDASNSMKEPDPSGGTRMDAAKRAVDGLIDQLPGNARVGLQVYGTGTGPSQAEKEKGCQDIKTLQPIGKVDKQAMREQVERIRPSGFTPVGNALRAAAEEIPTDTKAAIILVSDGEDTCAPPQPCEVAAELAGDGIEVQIHTVGFQVGDKAREQLKCIAEETGGTYTDASDAGKLEQRLPQITVLPPVRRFEPTGSEIDGGNEMKSAPVMKPGQYVDRYASGTMKYYRVDVPRDYTLHLSATQVINGDERDYVPQNEITIYDAEGEECASDYDGASGVLWEGHETVDLRYWHSTEADACVPAYFSLDRYRGETAYDMQLNMWLEPPVKGDTGPDADDTEIEFAEPGGRPVPVTGGGSFDDAPVLDGTGTYTDSIRTGEFLYYKVYVGWGQSLSWRATFGASDTSGLWAGTQMYTPTRQAILDYNASMDSFDEGEDLVLGPYDTTRRLYNNRDVSGSASEYYTMGGWNYLAVKVHPQLSGDPFTGMTSVRIDVSIGGKKVPAPEYAGKGIQPPVSGSSPHGGQGGTPKAMTASSPVTSGGPPWWLLAAIGAGVLVVVLTVVLLARRSRT